MRYRSTRAVDTDTSSSSSSSSLSSSCQLYTFEQAICSGYAPDGGLYVPEQIPSLEQYEIATLLPVELEKICYAAMQGFVHPNHAVPVVPLGNDDGNDHHDDNNIDDQDKDSVTKSPISTSSFNDQLATSSIKGTASRRSRYYIAELFHGPTFCFKDLGMQGMIHLMAYFATQQQQQQQQQQQPITLLVSTTGDTGPAAAHAVHSVNHPLLSLLVHYPHNQISHFQRKQLTTIDSSQVHVVAFDGSGDDMDQPIKNMLASSKSPSSSSSSSSSSRAKSPLLTGVNSYNIGRPLLQMVHYIWTYLRVMEQLGIPAGQAETRIDFVVPTGAMGNVTAGYMCQKLGIPIGRLCTAVNANDITYRVVSTGEFIRHPIMHRTMSEAMNIQVPYNFERFLYYLAEGNTKQVIEWMKDIEDPHKQGIILSTEWHTKLQTILSSARVTDDEMCSTIQQFHAEYKYLADPHTAVALCAATKLGYIPPNCKTPQQQQQQEHQQLPSANACKNVVAILATASPCKFEEVMTAAIGPEEWHNYCTSERYPNSARDIMHHVEKSPTRYYAIPGNSLNDNQREWEKQARKIVETFHQS
jgi:threonine synthase